MHITPTYLTNIEPLKMSYTVNVSFKAAAGRKVINP